MTNQKKKQTWEHSSVCALEDVEESKNDASKSTTSKITKTLATGPTPAIMLKQCEEIMANLKESSSSQHRDGGSGGPESGKKRDGFVTRPVWMVLREGIVLFSHQRAIHDGLGWRLETKMQEEVGEEDNEGPRDARLERSAPHGRGKDHDHQLLRSSSISHDHRHASERAKERRTREQVLPNTQRIKDTGRRRQEDQVQVEERVHAVDHFPTCIGEQNLQEEEQGLVSVHRRQRRSATRVRQIARFDQICVRRRAAAPPPPLAIREKTATARSSTTRPETAKPSEKKTSGGNGATCRAKRESNESDGIRWKTCGSLVWIGRCLAVCWT